MSSWAALIEEQIVALELAQDQSVSYVPVASLLRGLASTTLVARMP